VQFLAHLTLTPLALDEDGQAAPYTVETEFEASSWAAAWEHCLGVATKFGARMSEHRMIEIKPKTGEIIFLPPAPAAAAPVVPEKKEPDPIPDWFKAVKVVFCTPLPWPTELSVNG
jgi:hypothetical protein